MSIFNKLTHIYDAALSQSNWALALDQIGSAFQAKGALIYASNNFGIERIIQASNSLYNGRDDHVSEYMQRYNQYDAEAILKVFNSSKFEIIRDSDVWPNLNFQTEPLREDIQFVINTFGVKRRLGINISPNAAWSAGLVLQFDSSQKTFNEKHLTDTNWINRHLSKALEINRFYFQLQEQYNAILSVLDRVEIGICVVDAKGNVVISNHQAREYFSYKNGIYENRYGIIECNNNAPSRQIHDYIAKVSATASGLNNISELTMVIPKRFGDVSYLIEISPLRDVNSEYERSFSGCIITIIDPENPPKLSVEPITELYGFTNAESEVVNLLVSGNTIENIADIRGVAPDTVKNQCKSAYSKSGVKNRTQLIKKMISLTPPIK